MKICKGTTRIVIQIPALGIAIKIARIYLGRTIKGVFNRCFDRRVKTGRLHLLLSYFVYPPVVQGGLWNNLLWGILNNWREFRFYITTRHPLLQPTCFSLFGLVNIQKYG